MSEIVFLVEEAPEGGFNAHALGYSIYTEADNWIDLKDAIRDAIICHFEEKDHPEVVRIHFLREEVFAV